MTTTPTASFPNGHFPLGLGRSSAVYIDVIPAYSATDPGCIIGVWGTQHKHIAKDISRSEAEYGMGMKSW